MPHKAFLLYPLLLLCTTLSFANSNTSQIRNQYAAIAKQNGLYETLYLSPIYIEQELEKLAKKPFKFSKQQADTLKKELLIRFHPVAMEQKMLSVLSNEVVDPYYLGELTEYLSDEEAKNIFQAQELALAESQKSALLAYQKKLNTAQAQAHRVQLAKAVDALNYQSEWQALVQYSIQNHIYQQLNEKNQKKYGSPDELSLETETITYNTIVNLFALRKTKAEDIVPYLDTLALGENRHIYQLMDHALRETLVLRSQAKLEQH